MDTFARYIRKQDGPLAGLNIAVDDRGIWHMDGGRGPWVDWFGWAIAVYAIVFVGLGFTAGALLMLLKRQRGNPGP